MNKILLIILILLSSFCYGFSEAYQAQDGDIIFQTSRSSQSIAIQRATKSKYSHVGIVYIRNDQPFVFEAIDPVKLTPFKDWVTQGDGGHYVVKRLSNAKEILTPEALVRMLEVSKAFEGRHYDLYFEWSDDRIYCSELVWKIYKRGLDLEVGELQKMSEFDFSDPLVQDKVRERFGNSFPKNETVISPAAIFASDLLVTVYGE
jgi:hypothetical protein